MEFDLFFPDHCVSFLFIQNTTIIISGPGCSKLTTSLVNVSLNISNTTIFFL